MKIARRTALLAAASLALATPAYAQKTADTLRIQFLDAVPNVDMYFNSQRTGLILAHQAWDMLVHRDPATFEIKPSLATEWRFAEDNSLDLKIRQGVKFHDGSTLTAEDVVYTLNMAANPESKVATPSNYAWIDKAEKTGDFAVRIKMKRPTPAALEYLAMVTPIHPKAYREKVGPEGFAANPVGAGPYKIVKNVLAQQGHDLHGAIEGGVLLHRRQDAERQRDQQRDHQAREAERQSHRHALADQRRHAPLEEEAVAEIAQGGAPDPVEELRHYRPIESVGLAHCLNVGLCRVRSGNGNREVTGEAGQDESKRHHGRGDEQRDDQSTNEKSQHACRA